MIRTLLSTAAGLALSSAAWAWPGFDYELTITNITAGQTFTPQLVVTHPNAARVFKLGEPAGAALEILAEGGDTHPLATALAPVATDITTIDGLLGPGESASVVISGRVRDVVSLAAMLIPTNDTFVALDAAPLPRWGQTLERMVPAYDAGTEANDQDCASIPGPVCGGEGHSPGPNDGDEGFVHISDGFHSLGEGDGILAPAQYDWRNPVARITVKRMR
ncbi:spondin domain-containing protein [Parahaliea mediterranea]|uniref:Spondin domain-containing protein n=1 Tax=Parahaliea mediterranea TaxID=651086 RepID=A0A939ILN3_9GAMM|nr:spondin domain-containing protein [Parahaliea mediterranea]MBN7796158.1 spondin domain-containing protein [Parahaliea mediterranea]